MWRKKNEFSPLLLSPRQRWQFSKNNIMYNRLFYDNYSAIKDVQHKWDQKWRNIFFNKSKSISCTYHVKRVNIFDFFLKNQRSWKIRTWYYNFLIKNVCGTIGTSCIMTIAILNHLTSLVAGFHRKLDKKFSRRFS